MTWDKKDYTITFQGTDFVSYKGLLAKAHEEGLCRISTTLLQIPSAENGNVAIVAAEVETSKGTFSGIGDASPSNVNRMIVPHIIRQAETRAKARALRDAVNIGETAVEELGDVDEPNGHTQVAEASPHADRRRTQPLPPVAEAEAQRLRQSAETASTASAPQVGLPDGSPHKAPSANQLATIAKLRRLLGVSEEPTEGMTSAEASEIITALSRDYNARKGNPAGGRGA